jgi:AcrR family transcriptional regulator
MQHIEELNKKSLESQRKIYKSLRRLLQVKPLSEITVTDISEECDISRSTFYRNFNNVMEILEIFFDYYYDRYLQKRVYESNQLLFFLQYWMRHRDLVYILKHQAPGVIVDILTKYADHSLANYQRKIQIDLFMIIVSSWSVNKVETPEEMEHLVQEIFSKKSIEILLK